MRRQGSWRGEVTRVDGAFAWVKVRELSGPHEYGPCPTLEGVDVVDGAATGTTDTHEHTLTRRPLEKGDPVLVTFIGDRLNELVVVGRFAS